MLCDIKINQKDQNVTSGIIVTGQRQVSQKIDKFLSNQTTLASVFPAEPRFPLFDGIDDPKMRALIAIALGCDVLPGGVPVLVQAQYTIYLKHVHCNS